MYRFADPSDTSRNLTSPRPRDERRPSERSERDLGLTCKPRRSFSDRALLAVLLVSVRCVDGARIKR